MKEDSFLRNTRIDNDVQYNKKIMFYLDKRMYALRQLGYNWTANVVNRNLSVIYLFKALAWQDQKYIVTSQDRESRWWGISAFWE